MSNFHQSAQWVKLSKEHKTLRCRKCGTDQHIESDHILSQKRFKMFRLWSFNLQYLCGVEAKGCNLKKSDKLDWWYWKTYLLLGIYGMIKLIKYLTIGLIIFILIRYVHIDYQYNDLTVTNHIRADFIRAYEWLSNLIT